MFQNKDRLEEQWNGIRNPEIGSDIQHWVNQNDKQIPFHKMRGIKHW